MTEPLSRMPQGTRYHFGAEARLRRAVEDAAMSVFAGWSYEEVVTPALDYYSLFERGMGRDEARRAFRFADSDGRLLALRPDVTSGVARAAATLFAKRPRPLRLCYAANVFRAHAPSRAQTRRESTQLGCECVGAQGTAADAEVLTVAVEVLERVRLAGRFCVTLNSVEFFNGVAERLALDEDERAAMRQLISVRDAAGLEDFLAARGAPANDAAAFARLVQLPGGRELIDAARGVFANARSSAALDALAELWRVAERAGMSDAFEIDLGDVAGLDYYTGLTFKIYAAGAGARVGGGGRYDRLTENFGRAEPAVGFVLDLDALTETLLRSGVNELPQTTERDAATFARARGEATLTIALAKGRLQHEALAMLARAGVRVSDEAIRSRRLAVEDEGGRYRFVFVKPSDVPVYVEHGIADCGVVGGDVLMEADADLLQPLDLGTGCCRLVVAAPRGGIDAGLVAPRVATKYPRVAAAHFGARGTPVEIIALSGSVELAPVLGLADCIVDLVETGRTLAENGLEVVETVAQSSARLVVNRASYQLKAAAVAELIESLRLVVNESATRAEDVAAGCAERVEALAEGASESCAEEGMRATAEGCDEEVVAVDGGGGRL